MGAIIKRDGQQLKSLLLDGFHQLNNLYPNHPLDQLAIKTVVEEASSTSETEHRSSGSTSEQIVSEELPKMQKGDIYTWRDEGFGFIRDEFGVERFFHIKNIIDLELADKIANRRSSARIPVEFEAITDPKGPAAIRVRLSELEVVESQSFEPSRKQEGTIYSYKKDGGYGFLRAPNNQEYFFHQSAVAESALLNKLDDWQTGDHILVFFETALGTRGRRNPAAIAVVLYRDLEQILQVAQGYVDEGEYQKATDQIEQILSYDPNYPSAQKLCRRWREYAQLPNIPKGKSLYARARRAHIIEKDLETAHQLYLEAISQRDNTENAVKSLTALLAKVDGYQAAIEFLIKNRARVHNQRSVDDILIELYQKANQHNQAIALLRGKLRDSSKRSQQFQVLSQIANVFLDQGNPTEAENYFRRALRLRANNKAIQRGLAISLFQQERFNEAEDLLERILDTDPDTQAAELLRAVQAAKTTGQPTQIENIIVETTLSDFSVQASEFAKFMLAKCKFEGVSPEHAQSGKFNQSDLRRLERVTAELGTRRPRDRSSYYLSAAKIVSTLDVEDSLVMFYRYLGRSFASQGDAAVIEGKPLDVAREFYCETLSAYNNVPTFKGLEQDASNALVRYLFATLGHSRIPVEPNVPSITSTLDQVIGEHPDPDKVFDAIAYLVLQSRFAANQLLRRLNTSGNLRKKSLGYLELQGIQIPDKVGEFDDFVRLWNDLRKKQFEKEQSTGYELGLLHQIDFTTSSLETSIESLKRAQVYFDLDQQRLRQLQLILETALDLCKQVLFEEKERLCILIASRCKEALSDIEDNPTRFSIERLYPIIEALQKRTELWLEELYHSSMPQLTLRLPVDSYAPDSRGHIDVQIAVENRIGCGPAESLELIVVAQEDEPIFNLQEPQIKLEASLRSGEAEQRILQVPISLTEKALESKTFSLPIYAQYRTRSGIIAATRVNDFSIRLYSDDEFEELENPYAPYAEGGIVDDLSMFYGRHELIETTAKTIVKSRGFGKSIIFFGQKRAGKSSVLYHLKNEIRNTPSILVLDLGNIGSIIDPNSSVPFSYQILWKILNELEKAIGDKVDEGFEELDLAFPGSIDFYSHPTPLIWFDEIFDRFYRLARRKSHWLQTHIMLLIDEFSYIYGEIVAGRISESFMKNWKALLQKNYFSAVLAGQDVMPKFKQRFANEFGTTQDERISYLKPEDAKKLVDEPIRIGDRDGESRYREQAINRILDLTAGSPFYIQIVCNRLVEYMNRKKAIYVSEADVEQVKYELIRGVNAVGKDKFENLYNSGDTSKDAISDEDILKALTAIALNCVTGPCKYSSIGCETQTPIDEILQDLVDREVVERTKGEYYQIRVRFFEEWLVAHR